MSHAPRLRLQDEIDEIFKMMESAIRLHHYEADDLLYMIADLTPANATLAAAISQHAADFINEQSAEHTWTDIVVEAYRRALFDVEASPRYGTEYLVRDVRAMREFVTQYIRNQTLGDDDELVLAEGQTAPTAH